MKSYNNDSIEVNPSQIDFKKQIDSKPLNINSEESNSGIKHGFLSRLVIHILCFSYISSKINFNFQYIFGCIPLFIFNKLEIYRLITNFFVCQSLYELITGIIMISTVINNFEKKEGTLLFGFKLFYNLIISQIMLLLMFYLLSCIFPIVYIYRINSREFLCTAYLVKHLLTTETKKIINPFLGELNDRFIIVLFLLLYFFLKHEYRIENLFCLYYGFILCKYNNFFEPSFLSVKFINYIESSELGKILKISKYFISIKNSESKNNKSPLDAINLENYLNKNRIDFNEETIGLKDANNYENGDFMI